MGGLTRFVLRQRWPVVAAWVAVVLVSALASSDLLTNRFTLPSTDTRRAEVILVSRMREKWDNAATNEEAVVLGLTKTGRLVTSAGLIMFAALTGFVAGSVVGLQQFGFGLAAAILIDVTIVRALLVPSEMKLFGKWNWWLPDGVARILRVEPSPPGHRPPTLQPSGQ